MVMIAPNRAIFIIEYLVWLAGKFIPVRAPAPAKAIALYLIRGGRHPEAEAGRQFVYHACKRAVHRAVISYHLCKGALENMRLASIKAEARLPAC